VRAVRMLVVVLVVLAGLAAGCARRVPLSELGPAGAPVGVVLTTVSGEELSGRLLSFGDGKMVVEVVSADGASVQRTVSLGEVSRATFHRERNEAVFGPVVSFFLGPLVGALLALTF
jgi:hypothetical protein